MNLSGQAAAKCLAKVLGTQPSGPKAAQHVCQPMHWGILPLDCFPFLFLCERKLGLIEIAIWIVVCIIFLI
jgi:hypothetical protein